MWVSEVTAERLEKTKKSGTMLKAEISREQLGVASDKPPAAFNA